MEADLEGDISWTEVIPKGMERRTEGKLELINPKEQIMMVNHYKALAIESTASGKESGMKTSYENE
jgi:hypothetical protein